MNINFNLKNIKNTVETNCSDITLIFEKQYDSTILTETINLSAGNTLETLELLTTNNTGVNVTLQFDDTTGILNVKSTLNFNTEGIKFKVNLTENTNNSTLDLNLILYNIDANYTVYLTVEDTDVKASVIAIQEPLTDNIRYYNLSNSNVDKAELYIDDVLIHTNTTGIIQLGKSSTIKLIITYYHLVGTTTTTYTSTSYFNFTYDEYYPYTTVGYTATDYLINNLYSENTTFNVNLVSDYTLPKTLIQTKNIVQLDVLKHDLTSVYKQFLFDTPLLNTPLDFTFTSFNGLLKGDYVFQLTNYLLDSYNGVSNNALLTVGKYYYVIRNGSCTSISNSSIPISITGLKQIIYIDPSIYGLSGTQILFTGFNELSLIELTTIDTISFGIPYLIVAGSITINGTVYSSGTIILNNTDTYSITSNFKGVAINTDIIFQDKIVVETYSKYEILKLVNNTYSIFNKSFTSIGIEIQELSYSVDLKPIFTTIVTGTIFSNSEFKFTPSKDGIYKILLNVNGVITEYVIVSIYNIEQCFIHKISENICKCDCNSTCNCELTKVMHYVTTMSLYFHLVDMINDLIGVNTYYNELVSDDILKLHSLSTIIYKLNKFCNECN